MDLASTNLLNGRKDVQTNASIYYKINYHYASMSNLEKYSTHSKYSRVFQLNNKIYQQNSGNKYFTIIE